MAQLMEDSINPMINKTILFANKIKLEDKSINITFGSTPVLWSKMVNYLGVIIDSKLNFTKHIRN